MHSPAIPAPYANESDVLTIGNPAVENRVDQISVHGNVELTKDKAGVALAKQLQVVSASA